MNNLNYKILSTDHREILENNILMCISEINFKDSNSYEVFDKQEFIRNSNEKLLISFYSNNSKFFLKIWKTSNYIRVLKDWLKGGSRGVREVMGMQKMNNYNLKTPQVIAYGENRKYKFSFFITKSLENYMTFEERMNKEINLECIKDAARVLYNVHRKNLLFGDFHHENFLFLNNFEARYLDCLSVRETTGFKRKLNDIINFAYELTINSKINYKDEIIYYFNKFYLEFYEELLDKDKISIYLQKKIDRKINKKLRSF
jgi:tRNA A-37 threonylcarbamoyl transferase component Bud32